MLTLTLALLALAGVTGCAALVALSWLETARRWDEKLREAHFRLEQERSAGRKLREWLRFHGGLR